MYEVPAPVATLREFYQRCLNEAPTEHDLGPQRVVEWVHDEWAVQLLAVTDALTSVSVGRKAVPAATDQAVAATYATAEHGPERQGLRLTLLAAQRPYVVGEEVRVIHALEATQAGIDVYVMGPKEVYDEYVDGVARTAAAPVPDYPWVGVYDGAVIKGPAVDTNYDVTSYTFDTPGVHEIQWRVGGLVSNSLRVEVEGR